jgi:hypothetical protein
MGQTLNNMKILTLLENSTTTGTFVGIRPTAHSISTIKKFLKSHDIPNIIENKDMHVTVMYSTTILKNLKPLKSLNKIKATPVKFSLFGKENDTLVIELLCNELSERHYQLITKGATPTWSPYACHMTIAYDVPNLDKTMVGELNGDIGELNDITLSGEYIEPIKDDWNK